MNWYIRPFQLEDEEPYLNFLAEWVSDVPVRDRYQWLHRNNPHGASLTWVAVDSKSGRIIGCSSSFPKKVWLRDRVTVCTIGGDTYVSPKCRRRGIIDALHKALIKERQDRDMPGEFGFSLEDNLRALIRTGYQSPGNFLVAQSLLSTKPLLKKVKLAGMVPAGVIGLIDKIFLRLTRVGLSQPSDSKYVIKKVEDFDESFENLTREIISSFNVCCFRDLPFLKWRFFNNPFKSYTIFKIIEKENEKLHGYAALESSEDSLIVSDFFVRREDEIIESFLRALIRFGVVHSFNWIRMKVNPEGPYLHNLLRCGFRFNSSIQFPMITWSEYDKDYFVDLKNWYLTISDLDT